MKTAAETAGMMVRVVAQGAQTSSFTDAFLNTTYYFKIFPYTNSNGSYLDYKTDGVVPSDTVTIAELSAANDYFRSKANGNRNTWSTWVSYADSSVQVLTVWYFR